MRWIHGRAAPTPEIAIDLFARLGLREPHLGRVAQFRRRRTHSAYSGLAVGFDEEALYLMRLEPGERAIRVAFADIAELTYATQRMGGADGIFGWPGFVPWRAVSFSVVLKQGEIRATEVGVDERFEPGPTTSEIVHEVLADAQTTGDFFDDLAATANAAGIAIRERRIRRR